MKTIDLINELEDLIEKGSTLPFSSKALVNPEEALEIINEIKQTLPKEVHEAREIVNQKQQILMEAQNDADLIKKEAEQSLNDMINNNQITKDATRQAEKIVEVAQEQAKSIRVGTQHYADKILYNLQLELKQLNDTIEEDRKELHEIK